MTEVEITRHQIIVVDKVGTNSYGDLTWTDKENKPYKVKSTRKRYFGAIVPGQAVEISFASYKGTEYPYSVTAVKDKIEIVKPTHLETSGALSATKSEAPEATAKVKPAPVKTEMSKDDWATKDRITRKSIERQKSLELAVLLATAEKIKTNDIDAYFRRFEGLLEGNPLVEEAKKLGAKEDDIPF